MTTEEALSELRTIEFDLQQLADRACEALQDLGLSAEIAKQVGLEVCAPVTTLKCWTQQLALRDQAL